MIEISDDSYEYTSKQENREQEFQAKLKRNQQQLDKLEEFFWQKSQTSAPFEEFGHDVSNFDPRDQCITNNHLKLNRESQQEFGSGDGNELNITEDISDPINIDVDMEVEIELTTNFKLQSFLSESVEKLIYFLPITEKVPKKLMILSHSYSMMKIKLRKPKLLATWKGGGLSR
ncbi:hypothetical protein J1N35_018491 [Gossypium stocksii]|uniref:Uncharacterized protein n=1 Tax=Gossypium stocksii TaxID=47602 RepID=A0A9D3VPY7_9ROSI|nr:hypothetical protein J1N35_018491 [Gossypium stocksii]